MDLLTTLNATQLAVLGTVVAGVVELYSRVVAKDFRVVGKIVVALVAGTLIGVNYGLDFATAVAVGFIAPGGISILGHFGNKSTPAPSSIVAPSTEPTK